MSVALLVGSTGAVGKELVKLLANNNRITEARLLGRRENPIAVGDKFKQFKVDFDDLTKEADKFDGVDVVFCTLGWSYSGSGGKTSEQWKVDHDYVMSTANLAKQQGVKEFLLVSTAGANETSFINMAKAKGLIEKEIGELDFEKFVILRPSWIETKRENSRVSETLAKIFLSPVKLFSDRVSCPAVNIAQALVLAAQSTGLKGKVIWNNSQILKETKGFDVVHNSS